MALQQTLALINRIGETNQTFGVSIINGTITDHDLKILLDPLTFKNTDPLSYSYKYVSDENHSKGDAMKDFARTIGSSLTSEKLHQITARLIDLAPLSDPNTFMRNASLEKSFFAYEMAFFPDLAENHFSSSRMISEFPKKIAIDNLKQKILQPIITFFQTPVTLFFQAPSPQVQELIKLCSEYKLHLEHSVGISNLKNNDEFNTDQLNFKIDLATKKYRIITLMLDKLNDVNVDNIQRIQNMKKVLLAHDNKQCLKERRDSSYGARFVECILHVLTLGIYAKISKDTFLFWKSHGEIFIDKLASPGLKTSA